MGSQFKFSKILPVLFLVLIVLPAKAADNGGGGSGNPQAQFCDGLYQSCKAGCDAIDISTLAGGNAKRKCKDSCMSAYLSCWANAKKADRPNINKKKLP